MPKYNYYCKDCDEYFEIRHSMTEVLDSCVCCESGTFSRIPSIPSYINKIIVTKDERPGAIVEDYIKQNRQSVKEEKERLKKQEYKS